MPFTALQAGAAASLAERIGTRSEGWGEMFRQMCGPVRERLPGEDEADFGPELQSLFEANASGFHGLYPAHPDMAIRAVADAIPEGSNLLWAEEAARLIQERVRVTREAAMAAIVSVVDGVAASVLEFILASQTCASEG